MVLVSVLAAMLGTQPLDAGPQSCFAHPDAKLILDAAAGGMPHGVCVPSKNYSQLGRNFHFEGAFSNQGTHAWSVVWQFLHKTKTGDLYQLSIVQNGASARYVSFLYTGGTMTAYRDAGLSIRMSEND